MGLLPAESPPGRIWIERRTAIMADAEGHRCTVPITLCHRALAAPIASLTSQEPCLQRARLSAVAYPSFAKP
jgi:hypothetical protein